MPIVRSFGTLASLSSQPSSWTSSAGSLSVYGAASAQTYATIYRTQPNVRICVDFLARNFAQLGLHVYRRVSDTDRQRLAGHDLANWIHRPNPGTTRYRLFESLMQDLGIYFNAYWLKIRADDALGLVRLPPEQMTVTGGLVPSAFVWTVDGREKVFAPSEIVHFAGYDPQNPLMGVSPLETLRQVLAEQKAASDYREAYWMHGSRFEGVITTDKDSPTVRWTKDQKEDFRKQLQEFAVSGGRAGQMPMLPAGLDIKSTSYTAKDSEYLGALKLSREVCAAAYHIPQPMVGILDHATFSNVREQHKHLYQDSLGPWLSMAGEELERQLLIECADQQDVYLEFNIAEKLRGSFEEQASALLMSVGRPWQTVNEARGIQNLPRIDDPELDKVAPQQGGPATGADATPSAAKATQAQTIALELEALTA